MLIWIITLYGNGTSTVSLNTTLTGEFVTLQLPVQPQSYALVLVNGTPTAYMINGTSIVVPVLGTASVSITYVPKVFVEEGFIGMSVGNATVKLIIPSNILIYNITLSLISMSMVNGELIIEARGPGEFLYTVMPTTITKHTTHVTTTATHPPIFGVVIIILIAVIIIAAFTLYAMRTRQKRRGSEKGALTGEFPSTLSLNDYEMAIIRYLRSRGGSAFEVDISRDLGIPRTTVWRSVRRLEELGIVRITKVEGRNMAMLIRDPGI
ncbi:helix-turn-helix transcriptional regulator [Vulcanisaeta sp. JCM 14467]